VKLPDKDASKIITSTCRLGEWNSQLGNFEEARKNYAQAMQLTQSPVEKKWMKEKIESLASP
jgi:predicted RNA polymerase sigma factor